MMFFLYYPCYTGSVDGNHDHQVVSGQPTAHDFENSKGNMSLLYFTILDITWLKTCFQYILSTNASNICTHFGYM